MVAAALGEANGEGRITLQARTHAGSETPEGQERSGPSASDAADRMRVATKLKPIIDQRWLLDDHGEVTLTIALDRPLTASDFASVGAAVNEIERLVAGLKGGISSA